LSKGKTKELIEARKAAPFVVAAVALDALMELLRRDVIVQLGEDGAADMHAPFSTRMAGWVPEAQNGRPKLKSKKV